VAAMRERQPRGQLAGRLLWGLAVKGHHGGGHARLSQELGAPPIADGRNFDLVRPPTDVFFEMVNDHFSGGLTEQTTVSGWDQTLSNQSEAPVILRGRHAQSSEGKREGAIHIPDPSRSSADPVKEKSALSGCPQDFHASSTVFPQPSLVRLSGSELALGM
jgi:hypothetical protein